MKRIKSVLWVIKTGVLVMALLHIGLLVVLAIRDKNLIWINFVSIMDLRQFWPGLLNWNMGFWFFWMVFMGFLGIIWWLGEKNRS